MLRLRWIHRHTYSGALMECHMMLLKRARRCAYDLDHCASMISDEGMWKGFKTDFHNSSKFYQDLFTPDGIKDYREEIFQRIEKAEKRLEILEKLCDENNIAIPWEDERLPF